MLTNPVSHQDHSDQDEKGEGEHFDRRVPIDKFADRARGQQHDQHRNSHGGNHYPELFRHTHAGDNGIQRENDIEERDLQNRPEKASPSLGASLEARGLEFDVDFMGALRR